MQTKSHSGCYKLYTVLTSLHLNMNTFYILNYNQEGEYVKNEPLTVHCQYNASLTHLCKFCCSTWMLHCLYVYLRPFQVKETRYCCLTTRLALTEVNTCSSLFHCKKGNFSPSYQNSMVTVQHIPKQHCNYLDWAAKCMSRVALIQHQK